MSTSMDFGILPPLVWEHILCFLDVKSLVSCCQVCKDWNAFANESPLLWREACRKFGLKIREDEYCDSEYWKTYLRLVIERENRMKMGETFDISDITNSSGHISTFAYYKGKIAIAFSCSPQRIEVWNNHVSEISLDIYGMVPKYLKFDDKFIMAMFGEVRWWDIISKRCITTDRAGYSDCCSFDFLTEYNIVVGGFTNSFIHVWNLSTGNAVERIYPDDEFCENEIIKISLVPEPGYEHREQKVINLLSATKEEITVWTIKFIPCNMSSETMCVDKNFSVNPVLPAMSVPLVEPKLDGVHFDGKCFYYAQSSTDVNNNEIFVWDLDCNFFTHQFKVNRVIKNVLAVGKKYMAIHAENHRTNEDVLIVFDKASRTEAEVFSFPRDVCAIGSNNCCSMIIGETSWLDGLNGQNDEGIICLWVCNRNMLKAVKWVPRKCIVL